MKTVCEKDQFKHCILILRTLFILWFCQRINGQLSCDVRDKIANCTRRSLTQVPQNLPQDIREFLLSGNNLTQIKSYTFKKYTSLTSLDVSNSKVIKLENHSFFGLTKLQTLDLNDNALNLTHDAYPKLCFTGLTALKKLILGGNVPFKFLIILQSSFNYPDESLSELLSLEELVIDGLPDVVFGSGFRLLTRLNRLYFKRCYLNYIQEGMFVNTPNITQLSLNDCHIYDFHNTSLTKLPNIDTIDVSYNSDLGFYNATHLFYGLQRSPIRVIKLSSINPLFDACVIPPVDFFKHLYNTSLKELILDSNRIQALKPGTIKYFPRSVYFLSVRYNQVVFGQYIFEMCNLVGLKRVDFSDVLIGHQSVQPSGDDMPLYPWRRVPVPQGVEEIIGRNFITHAGIPSLIFMKNNITFIDNSQNGLSVWKGPVTGLHKLELLDLSMNYCSKVYIYFFNTFTSLRILNVSNNYLGDTLRNSSSRGLFDYLVKLEVLDMSNNRLKFFNQRMLSKNKMLKYLNVSKNQLFQYSLDAVHISLAFINLRGNELRTIPQNSRTALDQMNSKHPLVINLANNPFLCTCENLNFLKWMFFSTKLKFQNLNEYTCTDESGHAKSLSKIFVLAKKGECKSYAGLVFGLGFSIIFFLSVTAVGLIYRYRWRIKYLYYAAREMYLHRNQDNDEQHFTYDAFISFANEDLDFVDRLMTNLEGQGTRLCVHHRDFRLGEPIGSNIVKAVQNSKHTVVILSENFLASDWCRYEFEMARMEYVYSSRNVLFVVKIEDVRTAAVPRELLYMMNSESYLEYPDNAEDQATFWFNLHQTIQGN